MKVNNCPHNCWRDRNKNIGWPGLHVHLIIPTVYVVAFYWHTALPLTNTALSLIYECGLTFVDSFAAVIVILESIKKP